MEKASLGLAVLFMAFAILNLIGAYRSYQKHLLNKERKNSKDFPGNNSKITDSDDSNQQEKPSESPENELRYVTYTECPACGQKLDENYKTCPECGLFLR